MLQWLSDNVASFKLHQNAHRDFNMTVKDHLAHRMRIGSPPELTRFDAVGINPDADQLWELHATLLDGSLLDVASPTLEGCIDFVRARVRAKNLHHLAA